MYGLATDIGWTPRELLRHSFYELTVVLAHRMSKIKPKNTALREDQIDALFAVAARQQGK